jgi:hypothetical protein
MRICPENKIIFQGMLFQLDSDVHQDSINGRAFIIPAEHNRDSGIIRPEKNGWDAGQDKIPPLTKYKILRICEFDSLFDQNLTRLLKTYEAIKLRRCVFTTIDRVNATDEFNNKDDIICFGSESVAIYLQDL